MPTDDVRLSATVRGTVQGVGYRDFVRTRARALGLRGYVLNLPDGAVEVVAEGPRPQLDELVAALSRGPLDAAVRDVRTDWSPGEGRFDRFDIRFGP